MSWRRWLFLVVAIVVTVTCFWMMMVIAVPPPSTATAIGPVTAHRPRDDVDGDDVTDLGGTTLRTHRKWSAGDGPRGGCYPSFVAELVQLVDEQSRVASLYDPDFYPSLVACAPPDTAALRLSAWLPEEFEKYNWTIQDRTKSPPRPTTFGTLPDQVRRVKQFVSIALGRLVADPVLSLEWSRLSRLLVLGQHQLSRPGQEDDDQDGSRMMMAAATFVNAVLDVVLSVYQGASITLRLVAEVHVEQTGGSATAGKSVIDDVRALIMKSSSKDKGDDNKGKEGTGRPKATAACQRWAAPWRLVRRRVAIRARMATASMAAQHVASFNVGGTVLKNGVNPVQDSKYWVMVRPTLSCRGLVRMCNDPEGCRFLCNGAFLRHAPQAADLSVIGYRSFLGRVNRNRLHDLHVAAAPPTTVETAATTKAAFLTFVGFGSNNEYEWEEGILRTFREGKRGENLNVVGSVTVFDCTLAEWRPPATLLPPRSGGVSPIGLGVVSRCLDREISATALKIASLNRLLNGERSRLFEADGSALLDGTIRDAGGSARWPSYATAPSTKTSVRFPGGHVIQVGRYGSPAWSDQTGKQSGGLPARLRHIAVLKMDVESYEFVAVPRWLRDDLMAVARQPATVLGGCAAADGRAEVVDDAATTAASRSPERGDDDDAPLSVGSLQLELHRMGHKRAPGESSAGALHTHLLMLNFYALGFSPYAMEPNFWDHCCFEVAWESHRAYVSGEVWSVAAVPDVGGAF